MKFCSNLSFMFTSETASIIERYTLARDAGFKAVESGFPFGFSLDEVVEAKNKSGLEQVLINIFTGDVTKGELGVAAIQGKEEEFQKNLELTINYAKGLSCRKIHVMSGKIEGTPSSSNWEAYETNLKFAAERFSKENMLGLIEPINSHSIPKYFLNNYEKAVEVLDKVNSPNLKLMLDIFHLQQIKGDLTNTIRKLWPYVGHIQIAQVPSRNEPDTSGEINYAYVLKVLEDNGYDDWVGLEYKPLSGTKEGLQWIRTLGYDL